jgi:hypothetical protein
MELPSSSFLAISPAGLVIGLSRILGPYLFVKVLLVVMQGLLADYFGEGVFLVPRSGGFFEFGHDGDGIGDEEYIIVH